MSKPFKEWPQIVLTNKAKFKGHSGLEGASAFLVKTYDGRTLAATAKHLIGEAGGVEPPIPVAKLNGVIRSWRMHPRTVPDRFIEVEKIGTDGLNQDNLDWLLLTLKGSPKEMPATALQIRQKPVQVGEKVFLIGCPYAEPKCKQNVYKGKVIERAHEDRFAFDLDPPVDLRGFSGAPIIDRDGYLVGVMTVWFDRQMSGDKDLKGGGEDAAFVNRLLKK